MENADEAVAKCDSERLRRQKFGDQHDHGGRAGAREAHA